MAGISMGSLNSIFLPSLAFFHVDDDDDDGGGARFWWGYEKMVGICSRSSVHCIPEKMMKF
jgi:hypothetical protein